MADLERELRALELDWPATPDLAAAVERRLGAPAAPRRPRRLVLAWVAAAVFALVAAGLAASPDARSALLDLLGLRGARVERREPPPAPAPKPGTLGSGLRLGRAVTLDTAAKAAGLPLTTPASLGTPDAVWLDGDRVSLVYDRRPGIPRSPHTNVAVLLTQFRARATPVLQKALGAGAELDELTVDGARAFLITGEPHGFAFIRDDGSVDFEDRRLAGNTLLVERDDGVLLRAEGKFSPARARALARELARR